jgi:phosphotransferase system enzyme I (PtsP)
MAMQSAVAAARAILTSLHEVMASRAGAQAKLNQVVEVIGESLNSEVCSIYLLREGMLELFATRGLNQSAVHVTRLAVGEGLVGTIAERSETLNLAEAASHPTSPSAPKRARKVPFLRRRADRAARTGGGGAGCPARRPAPVRGSRDRGPADRGHGAVGTDRQCRTDRRGGNAGRARAPHRSGTAQGADAGQGLGAGMAVFHQPRVTIEHIVAEDIEAERQRVYLAFDKMREQIERMAQQAEFGVGGEHEEVLETYKMFAYDEGWSRRINEAIDSGLTAEAAIERVQQRTRMRMRQIDDALLADRMHDLEDLSNRCCASCRASSARRRRTGCAGIRS